MINGELIVDNFAGGGGASTGIEEATGFSVDIANKSYTDPVPFRNSTGRSPGTDNEGSDHDRGWIEPVWISYIILT